MWYPCKDFTQETVITVPFTALETLSEKNSLYLHFTQFNDTVRCSFHRSPLFTQVLRIFLNSSTAVTREAGASSDQGLGEYMKIPAWDRTTIQIIPTLKMLSFLPV